MNANARMIWKAIAQSCLNFNRKLQEIWEEQQRREQAQLVPIPISIEEKDDRD